LTTLKKMGVLAHPLRPQTHSVAESIAQSLQARGIETWVYSVWNENEVQDKVQTAEMVIAIGGDGAMLRAARVCAPYQVPVLGYNMGQLGFLTEIAGSEQWEQNLQQVLDGNFWIEQRMMLSAMVLRDGMVVTTGEALNDVVVSGSMVGRMIQLEM
jgi:NAD+ kinase